LLVLAFLHRVVALRVLVARNATAVLKHLFDKNKQTKISTMSMHSCNNKSQTHNQHTKMLAKKLTL